MRDLPSLSEQHVNELILKSVDDYRRSHIQEVEDMIRIIDPSFEYKTEESGIAWKKKLMEEWQLHWCIKSIHPDIITIITKKCRGNPYLCLDYFRQMVHTGYV